MYTVNVKDSNGFIEESFRNAHSTSVYFESGKSKKKSSRPEYICINSISIVIKQTQNNFSVYIKRNE